MKKKRAQKSQKVVDNFKHIFNDEKSNFIKFWTEISKNQEALKNRFQLRQQQISGLKAADFRVTYFQPKI